VSNTITYEWFVTFGMRYAHETHPYFPDAHPDGWVVIEADTYEEARRIAVRRLGPFWAFVYGEDDPPSPELFPRGELARWPRGGRS